jgi:multiple sugar transport system permease protein
MSLTTAAPRASVTAASRAAEKPLGSGAWVWPVIFLAPYVIVLLTFVAYPVVYGIYLGSNPTSYRELFQDPAFATAAWNTAIFLGVAVNLKFLLALGLSGFFAQDRWWIRILLVIFILPWAVPSIPTILSFRFMLGTEYGMINSQLFRWFQIDGPDWLNNPSIGFAAACVVHIWKSLPFWTLILLTGRLAIPKDQYEAAAVDGATGWQQFRHITWPAIATLYLTSTILSMIWTLGDFNSVYLLTGGGPGDKTHVLATLGIRYLRIDKLDLGVAAIITALPFMLPLMYFMVKRLSRGPEER